MGVGNAGHSSHPRPLRVNGIQHSVAPPHSNGSFCTEWSARPFPDNGEEASGFPRPEQSCAWEEIYPAVSLESNCYMQFSHECYAELTDLSKAERRRTLPIKNSDV
jgi:hypothetical protein